MLPSVGQQLRQAREARELDLEQVSKDTYMRPHYLRALEEGNLEALPSLAQARGFLRAYASYLGLDPEPLLQSLDQDQPVPPVEEPKANPAPATRRISSVPAPSARAALVVEPPEETEQAFREIGQKLRRQRELLGLSLDDVERHTHLRQHYLVALETGDLPGLPSPVQGRGMLNNYATFLGLDPEPLLLRFAEGLQAHLSAAQEIQQAPRRRQAEERRRRQVNLPAPLRRLFSGDIIVGVVLTVALGLFILWGAVRIFSMSADQPVEPTAPSIADVLLATDTPTPTFTPLPPTPTAPQPGLIVPTVEPTEDVSASGPAAVDSTGSAGDGQDEQPEIQTVTVYVTVNQRAWMRVTVDGKVQFEGRVLPGSAYSYTGEERVEILTGNGAALQVFFNQQDLGTLGFFGEVVNEVFTLDGVQTPTPTVTPTGTATLPVTSTSAVTPTPQGTLPALP